MYIRILLKNQHLTIKLIIPQKLAKFYAKRFK